MLEGITAQLTGNISDYIIPLQMPSIITAIGTFILTLVLAFLLIYVVSIFVKISATKVYRERLVDLYVSGTVRKLAKEDGIDLDEEFKEFTKQVKKANLKEDGLANTIENELSEKVVEKQEKKVIKK